MRGRALPCVLAFATAALAAAACDGGPGEQVISRPPVAIAPIGAHRVADRILVTGELIAVNEASVAAEVDGRVTSILVEEGEAVEAGDVVFEIDRERRQLELEDAPRITQELLRRGYAEKEIRGILGENWLRVCEAVWG